MTDSMTNSIDLSILESRAIELAHVLGGDYLDVLQAMANQLHSSFAADANVDQLVAAIQETLPEDEMHYWCAEVYMNVYTVDEIEQLLVFHRSPIGQRMRTLTPMIMAACAQKMQSVITDRLPAALRRHGLA